LTSGYSDAQVERQSARMSKITNDGLTPSGTGCFKAEGVELIAYHTRLNTKI